MNVPDRPLLEDGSWTTNFRSHLVRDGSNARSGVFEPDGLVLAMRRRVVLILITGMAILTAGVMVWLQPAASLLGGRGWLSAAAHAVVPIALEAVPAVFIVYAMRRIEHNLAAMHWDEQTVRVLDGAGGTVAELRRGAVIGIQAVAARDRIGRNGNTNSVDATEVNLVYASTDRQREQIERTTLYRHAKHTDRDHRVARELADAMGVPLIDHTTQEHWAKEKSRSARRPFRRGGISG